MTVHILTRTDWLECIGIDNGRYPEFAYSREEFESDMSDQFTCGLVIKTSKSETVGYCLLDVGTDNLLDAFMVCCKEGAGDMAVISELINYLKQMRLNSLRQVMVVRVRCEDFDMCKVLNSLGLHCDGYDEDEFGREGDLLFSYSLTDGPIGLPYYEKDLGSD